MTQLSNFSKYFTCDAALEMILEKVNNSIAVYKENKSNEHLRELGLACKMIEDYLQDHGVSVDVVISR